MKKILIVLLIICSILTASCTRQKTAAVQKNIFSNSPDDIAQHLNQQFTDRTCYFPIDGYTEDISYFKTTMRTYKSEGATLSLLFDTSQDVSNIISLRIGVTDYDKLDQVILGVKGLIELSDDDEETMSALIKSYEAYSSVKVQEKNFTMHGITYTYEWRSGSYIFTISKGNIKAVGWSKKVTYNKAAFRISEDWKEYYKYDDDLGIVYETPTGLKVSFLKAVINPDLLSLQYDIKLDVKDPKSVATYLTKEFEKTTKTLAVETNEKAVLETPKERSFDDKPGLEASYFITNDNKERVTSNQQFTFIDDSTQYSVLIEKNGNFSEDDISIYNGFINSLTLK
jgi:hypothetical protein